LLTYRQTERQTLGKTKPAWQMQKKIDSRQVQVPAPFDLLWLRS